MQKETLDRNVRELVRDARLAGRLEVLTELSGWMTVLNFMDDPAKIRCALLEQLTAWSRKTRAELPRYALTDQANECETCGGMREVYVGHVGPQERVTDCPDCTVPLHKGNGEPFCPSCTARDPEE